MFKQTSHLSQVLRIAILCVIVVFVGCTDL